MSSPRRRIQAVAAILSLALPAAAGPPPAADTAQVVHVLNRLGYGPAPGDVDRVQVLGVSRWIDEQLHPERIDDSAVKARLASLKTVGLSTHDLLEGYEVPREAKKALQQEKAKRGENASESDMRQVRREVVLKYAPDMKGSPKQVLDELQEAKILRAAYSPRQLDEVMADFWFNHFNVYANKGPERFAIGEYERDVIRGHAWGRFEDLLHATAESPAMLVYLDNYLSVDPTAAKAMEDRRDSMRTRRGGFGRRTSASGTPAAKAPAMKRSGLNENYARELMELHTLGVDGGYTQKDVTEVARCFTGWTVKGIKDDRPEFIFDARLHDHGDKVVLGHRINGSGQDEGEQVLHLLATQPATARFVSAKLVRRFVSDEPPLALVDRAAETFRRTDGNIREVVRTIVTSPEFLGTEYRTAKVKTPFEFVVSAVRASGATVTDASDLSRRVTAMGMPLYQQQPPTGYKDTADAWVSTGGLLARLNLAIDLAAGRVRGVTVDPSVLGLGPGAGPGTVESALVMRLLPGGLSETTKQTLSAEKDVTPVRLAGLILGSPEFQRR